MSNGWVSSTSEIWFISPLGTGMIVTVGWSSWLLCTVLWKVKHYVKRVSNCFVGKWPPTSLFSATIDVALARVRDLSLGGFVEGTVSLVNECSSSSDNLGTFPRTCHKLTQACHNWTQTLSLETTPSLSSRRRRSKSPLLPLLNRISEKEEEELGKLDASKCSPMKTSAELTVGISPFSHFDFKPH